MKITNAYFLKELVQAAHYFTFDRTVKAVKILAITTVCTNLPKEAVPRMVDC